MNYGDAFYKFLDGHSLGQIVESSDGEKSVFLHKDIVDIFLNDRYAVNASKGGLVIGKFHVEGGVHMLQPFDDGYRYVGDMEGFEFLLNPKATRTNALQFNNLNLATRVNQELPPQGFHIPSGIRKIDLTNLRMHIIVLPKDPVFIVNRAATEKHLRLINKMNNQGLRTYRR